MIEQLHTIGEIVARFGVREWQIDYLIRCGKLTPSGRVGRYRTFRERDLLGVEKVLRAAGYLK